MKYIICGIEHIGIRVIDFLLSRNENVSLITLDSNELLLRGIKERVSLCVHGDARFEEILEQAGARSADVLMALTGNDVTNFGISSAARKINDKLRVITRLSAENINRDIETVFNIDRALSSTVIAAPSFASACISDVVLHAFSYRDSFWYISRLKNTESMSKSKHTVKISNVSGDLVLSRDKTLLRQLHNNIRNSSRVKLELFSGTKLKMPLFLKWIPKGIVLVALAYLLLVGLSALLFCVGLNYSLIDAIYFIVTTTTTVGFGDFNFKDTSWGYKLYGSFLMLAGAAFLASLYSVVTDFFIGRRLDQLLGLGKLKKTSGHIIVAGLGRIGSRVATMLHKNGFKVVGIESNVETEYVQSLQGQIPIVAGDAQQAEILSKARVRKACAIAAVTDDDLRNTNIILQGKRLNGALRTIARIFNKTIENNLYASDVFNCLLSSSSIAAPIFVASALWSKVITAFTWEDSIYVIFEFRASDFSSIKGSPIKNMIARYNFQLLTSDVKAQYLCLDDINIVKDSDVILLGGDYADFLKFCQMVKSDSK
jgi:Trk K+ transport system NAD-binding subunit